MTSEADADGRELPPELPDFPVDDGTLEMLWAALHPDWSTTDRTSVQDFLVMMSELGGSDTDAAVEEYVDEDPLGMGQPVQYRIMRDRQYHEHNVLEALIVEVRRLRAELALERS